VRPKQLQAVGSVVCVRSSTDTPVVRLLVVHTGSGAAVWDVRPQQLLAVVNTSNSAVPYTRSARGSGNVTAACWLHNPKRGDFATGHEYGDVNIWAMPAGAAGGTPGAAAAGEANLVPTLLVQLQVAPPPCRAIRSLQHVYGKHEQLLVFGGQDQDQPDGLVLLPLPKHNQVRHGEADAVWLRGPSTLYVADLHRPGVHQPWAWVTHPACQPSKH
jgi:hypothetical protein